MNKKLASICVFLMSVLSFNVMAAMHNIYEDHPYELKVTKTAYNFYEDYDIFTPSEADATTNYAPTYSGAVKKSAFRIRTNYDLYDQHGWQATGITRVLSLGSLYSWATQIDIYDTHGLKIGLIDGNLATLESAKFSIYQYDVLGVSHEVAFAVANETFTQFSITGTNGQIIGEANRERTSPGSWSIVIDSPNVLDDRVVRIFAAFLSDYQNKFL